MKLAKKFVAHLLMIAMLLLLGVGVQFRDTTVKAAGDYRSLAQNLPLNGTWTADQWITENNEEKWYKFSVTDGGKLTLKIMGYMPEIRVNLATEDLSQYVINDNYCYTNGTDTSPGTKTYTEVLSAGTYYIKISQSPYYGKFKICATFENYGLTNQGADSYDSPKVVPVNQTITGAITETDKEDWYRLNVTTAGKYVIDISAYMGSLYFNLYNQDLSDMLGSDGYPNGTETTPRKWKEIYTLNPGSYYIKMSASSGGKYLLSWSDLTQENCSHDYDSTYVYATYLSQGYRLHTCKNCGHQYKDEFSSKKVLNQVSYPYASAGKRKMTVSFWSVSDADGYQIRYSTNKKFKKDVKLVKTKSTRKTIKKLKRRKKYYVQIRAYKKVQGKTVYGKWSAKKSAKIK